MTNKTPTTKDEAGDGAHLVGALSKDEPHSASVREYCLREYYFWIGIVCTVGFFVFAVGSFVAAWWNIDGSFRHPRATAIGLATFWSCWLMLGAWILFAYFRERLVISTERIRQTGCFRTRAMRHDEVLSARWRRFPGRGGSVVLKGANTRIVIEFDKYANSEQAELRTIFRSILDKNVHENWEKYESSVVFRRPPDPRTIRRVHTILIVVLLAFAIAFGALAFAGIGNQVELLITAGLNLAAAVWLTFHIRSRKGTDSDTVMQTAS